jgi:hypothetical protein
MTWQLVADDEPDNDEAKSADETEQEQTQKSKQPQATAPAASKSKKKKKKSKGKPAEAADEGDEVDRAIKEVAAKYGDVGTVQSVPLAEAPAANLMKPLLGLDRRCVECILAVARFMLLGLCLYVV